ncbi:MAG TPA: hypothetical protein ENN99_13050 [Chloroflexi bacterium]|nr:hypothetical protein [Chloroflexota bacterium]
MARRKQTRGTCVFCGKEMTRGGLARHLPSCQARRDAVEQANQKGGKEQTTIYHLQVRDAWDGDYWLHVEMNGTAALEDLDRYLRAIWLECCGHLSQFSFGGWSGNEIPMGRRIEQVLRVGDELTHIYDFGTSSETLIRAVGVRSGKPLTGHPIKLMARNNAPEFTCVECGQRATWWCPECVYGLGESGLLCDEHAKEHPHDDYGGIMPVVNSPRMGMCGYVGPADPPY